MINDRKKTSRKTSHPKGNEKSTGCLSDNAHPEVGRRRGKPRKEALVVGSSFILLLVGAFLASHFYGQRGAQRVSRNLTRVEEELGKHLSVKKSSAAPLKESLKKLRRRSMVDSRIDWIAAVVFGVLRRSKKCHPDVGDLGTQASCWLRRGCLAQALNVKTTGAYKE